MLMLTVARSHSLDISVSTRTDRYNFLISFYMCFNLCRARSHYRYACACAYVSVMKTRLKGSTDRGHC